MGGIFDWVHQEEEIMHHVLMHEDVPYDILAEIEENKAAAQGY